MSGRGALKPRGALGKGGVGGLSSVGVSLMQCGLGYEA